MLLYYLEWGQCAYPVPFLVRVTKSGMGRYTRPTCLGEVAV